MTPFAVVVDLFDPARPDDGEVYAGETRLFVLGGETLAAALQALVDAVEAKGSSLLQVHTATPVAEFDRERFAFDADLDAMARDSIDAGRPCVSPDYPFATYPAPMTGVFWGMFDIFDPEHAKGFAPYAGEIRWAAAAGTHAGDALRHVLSDLAVRNCVLKSVDDLAHIVFYDRETPVDGRPLGTVAGALMDASGVTWADGASFYERDND